MQSTPLGKCERNAHDRVFSRDFEMKGATSFLDAEHVYEIIDHFLVDFRVVVGAHFLKFPKRPRNGLVLTLSFNPMFYTLKPFGI